MCTLGSIVSRILQMQSPTKYICYAARVPQTQHILTTLLIVDSNIFKV